MVSQTKEAQTIQLKAMHILWKKRGKYMVTLSNMLTTKLESHNVEKQNKKVVNRIKNQRKSRINNRKS